MSKASLLNDLSKRERQVIEIVFRLKNATARDVERALVDAPTYSAVRSILRILMNKRLLIKKRANNRDWYSCSIPGPTAKAGMIRSFVRNFFNDSPGEAACALLGQKNFRLSEAEADELLKLIEEAREQ